MKTDIEKLQTSNFMDDGDEKYLDGLSDRIVDHQKSRELFCDFEANSKKSAKKLSIALKRLGFESSIDDFDEKNVESCKLVNYANAKYALNLAMYEAWRHNCTIHTLMLEQDIVPTKQTNDKQHN